MSQLFAYNGVNTRQTGKEGAVVRRDKFLQEMSFPGHHLCRLGSAARHTAERGPVLSLKSSGSLSLLSALIFDLGKKKHKNTIAAHFAPCKVFLHVISQLLSREPMVCV